MRWFPFLFRRRVLARQLDRELRFHLEQQISGNVASGMSPEEARRRASLDFGGMDQIKEDCRDVRPAHWLEDVVRDLRFGVAVLRRSPGMTALAVLTLGVALGTSAIMFSIVDGVLLKPLPYADADRLVRLQNRGMSNSAFVDCVRQSQALDVLVGVQSDRSAVLTGSGFPERIDVLAVTVDFFNIFGSQLILGRGFQSAPAGAGMRGGQEAFQSNEVVLSRGLWQRHFGGDRNVIGRSVRIDGKPFTVVGIAADVMYCTKMEEQSDKTDCWMPCALNPEDFGNGEWIGRIRKGSSLTQAQAEMDVIVQRAEKRGLGRPIRGLQLIPLQEIVVGWARPLLLALFAAVLCLLLTAAANIAGLMLSRAAMRQKEIAVRAALGASRWRLIRQWLTEIVLLCLLGGVAGVVLAAVSQRAVLGAVPGELPKVSEIAFDTRTFAFTLGTAFLVGLVCGILLALRASKTHLADALKEGILPPAARNRGWLGQGLVSVQIGLALILLITMGLLIRSYLRVQAAPFGFDATHVLSVQVRPPDYKEAYRDFRSTETQALYTRFYDSAIEQFARIPGVGGVGMGPFRWHMGDRIWLQEQGKPIYVDSGVATPDYFRVFGLHLLAGRLFQTTDSEDPPRVAVVNQALAEKLWPGSSPLGRRIFRRGLGKPARIEAIQIVGLIGDHRFWEGPPFPTLLLPKSQGELLNPELLVRTRGNPLDLVAQMRKALQTIDSEAPLGEFISVEQWLYDGGAFHRFSMLLISIFAGIAFILATMGIYSTIAGSVARRTHEIGVRMALGAQRRDVVRLVLKQGFGMLLVGEAIGLAGASAANRILSKMFLGFFGNTSTDKTTYVVVSSLLAVIAILASYIPARKATAIDPLKALRCE